MHDVHDVLNVLSVLDMLDMLDMLDLDPLDAPSRSTAHHGSDDSGSAVGASATRSPPANTQRTSAPRRTSLAPK